MKVGILTFHRAVNYGAVLQAWALQTFLINKGYDACIVDYRCRAIEGNYKLISINKLLKLSFISSIKYFLSRITHFRVILNRNQKFKAFISNRLHLVNMQKVHELDAVITGSDQVWNPFLTGGLDDYYFLNVDIFKDKIKIAYAVSSEPQYIDNDFLEKSSPYIQKIPNLSVRESNLKDKLNIQDAIVCVDPTFLLTYDEWKVIGENRVAEGDYIFVFEVVPSILTKRIARYLSKKYNLKIIFLSSGFKFLKRTTNLNFAIGPDEFVSLIRFARFVVTTSFHGIALSLLLRKQFVVAPTKHMNRQMALLKKFGLDVRIITDLDMLHHIQPIKYSTEIFDKLSETSKEFLISNLNYDKAFKIN